MATLAGQTRSPFKSPAYQYVRTTDRMPALGSTEAEGPQALARVKLFSGAWTWYLTEYDPESRMAFGLTVGMERELGYVSLDELIAVRGAYRLPIERDLHWQPRPLAECA